MGKNSNKDSFSFAFKFEIPNQLPLDKEKSSSFVHFSRKIEVKFRAS